MTRKLHKSKSAKTASTATSSRPSRLSVSTSRVSIAFSRSASANDSDDFDSSAEDSSGSESLGTTTPVSSLRSQILDMAVMTAAIDAVARGSDERRSYTALLEPDGSSARSPRPSLSPGLRPRSARRSRGLSGEGLQKYDVRDDEPPPHRFHSVAVQNGLVRAKSAMASLRDVLASGDLHDDTESPIFRFHEQADALADFECLTRRTVGFVGASGAGKSSLLNALLDAQELAVANGTGSSCTAVVTEYHYHDKSDFVIDVELLSFDDVMEQIREMLKALRWRDWCRRTEYTFADKDEEEDTESKATIASDTFQAMFRGRIEGEDLLSGPDDDMLATLQGWAKELMPKQIGGRKALASLDACSEKLRKLTSEAGAESQPAVWPYIRKIKVFLNAHILSKGLVLVDLPGLRDVNMARQLITEKYLRQCDDIFAVTCSNRAAADVGVKDVFELGKQAGLSNIGIIATKSDDVQATEDRSKKARQLQDAIKTSQTSAIQIDNEIKELEQQQEEDDLLEEEEQELMGLMRQARGIKAVQEKQEAELKTYLVNKLAASLEKKLIQLYGSDEHPLPVFCVSSRDYWKVREHPKSDAVMHLINLSGIPAVRRHCLALIADSNLRRAADFVSNDIPALLGDVGLWVGSGSDQMAAKQKKQVYEALTMLERRLEKELMGRTSPVSTFGRSLNYEFYTHICRDNDIKKWSREAQKAASEWATWAYQSYFAFCRKYGIYCTSVAGEHNWNAETIAAMVTDLDPRWDALIAGPIARQLEQIISHVDNSLEKEVEHLDNVFEACAQSPDSLVKTLQHRGNLLVSEIKSRHLNLEKSILALRADTLGGARTSIIGEAMETAYRDCNNIDGAGSYRKKKNIIHNAIWREDLFTDLIQEFWTRLYVLAEGFQEDVDKIVLEHIKSIRLTLEIVRSENIATESEQNPQLRQILEAETDEAKAIMRQIQRVVR